MSLLDLCSAAAAVMVAYAMTAALYYAAKHDCAVALWAVFAVLFFIAVLFAS